MNRRTASTVAALAAAALVVGGCTATVRWRSVALPADVRPASLAAAGDGLLVGGHGSAGPVLVRVTGVTAGASFSLEPHEPAATDADLIWVTADGDDLYAVGRWFGGAHSNPRLTMWDGTAGSNHLTHRPQEFWTFGGHDAGNLLGVEVLDGRAVIFGLRSGAAGIEGVVWTRAGHTWTKHVDVDPSLVSSPDRVVSFTALDRLGDRLVVAGDELGLSGGLNQQPSVWAGPPGGPWTQALLPVPADLAPVSGQLSRATAVACDDGAGCWVAGWVRGRPVVWAVGVAEDGKITVGPPTVLEGTPASGADPEALLTLVAGRPVVLTGAAAPTLQLGCPDAWRSLAAPPGKATALTAAASGLYAITSDGVQRLDPPHC
ncbi:MAG TPA: hypothetical protein VGK18_14330 [Propionicimonas sp.]|jgi:hypothetical protein|uniref:hypothetical protein n=1 Tax=Propionicimonas sp. TaxID=1955623 RepID=UPI002F4165D9